MNSYVVAVSVADVRRAPDSASELVTQALMNVPALVGEISNFWTYVTLPDYIGWVCSDELATPIVKGFCKVGEDCATPLDLVAVVIQTHAPLYSDAEQTEKSGNVYLSTVLPLLDTTHPGRLQVALPGDDIAWVAREDVSIRRQGECYPLQPCSTVTSYARAFEGVPYLWGGASWEGIDCSAFVQLCYRMAGYVLPRDADQQHDQLYQSIEKDEMREGDLIFFGETSITHVALALNSKEYIHAEGVKYERVVINSFDPIDVNYNSRLVTIVWAIKRVIS